MPRKLSKGYPRFLRREAERRYSAAATLAAPGFTASLTVPSIAGILVTPQTALTVSAYYAGVRVICEDTSSLPFAVFQHLQGGGSKLEWQHYVSQLFHGSPDGECNDMNWRESYMSHVLGWGNGYAEIEWAKGGYPLALHLIHPSVILPKRNKDGRLFYELQTATSGQTNRIAEPWQILHFAGLGFNGLVGYSPVALCRESLGLSKAAEQFGASLFGNGAIPKGVIEYPGKMKPDAAKNFIESWNLFHQSSAGANKTAILEEGMKWVNTQIPPDDAQFLATRAFQVIDIARILRLAPHKLGDYSQANQTNVEASNDDHIASCLRPWTVRFEKTVDLKLLTAKERAAGFYTKTDFRPLILQLSKDRADYYRKLAELGVYTPSEIAQLEGKNPIPDREGGNKRFRPANLVELDSDTPPVHPNQAPPTAGQP